MLVLSRKPDDAITFPDLGITVRVLRTNQRSARIGIEAPPEVHVVRKELLDGTTEELFDAESMAQKWSSKSRDLHELRNNLNTLNLGLQYYRHQMDAGLVEEANSTFQKILDQLSKIEKSVSDQEKKAIVAEAKDRSKRPIRLLVVEDDEMQRELLAGVLRARGCEVATAASGNDAIEYLSLNESPDFVLVDMRMPHGDGASMVRRLRETEAAANLKIVAASGTNPERLGITIGKDGVDRWFPKPLNTEGLMQYMDSPDGDQLNSAV